MITLRKILVTTDLSNHSRAAFEHAFSLSILYGAKITLLYVAERPPVMGALYSAHGNEHLLHEEIETSAMQRLREFVTKNVSPDHRVQTAIRIGDAATEIAKYAAEEGVDLIVMATHGWTGLKHLVLGSVAETVVRIADVPVLTVKPPADNEPILQHHDVETELHLNKL